MFVSDTGHIAENCWKAIPVHFPNSNVDVFQIMPNHIHGIVEIREPHAPGDHNVHPGMDGDRNINVGVEYIQPLQGPPPPNSPAPPPAQIHHVTPKSLGSIIRSFKAAVTREINGGKEYHRSI
jgi:hypothetical protein